jgi:hypothetical protein
MFIVTMVNAIIAISSSSAGGSNGSATSMFAAIGLGRFKFMCGKSTLATNQPDRIIHDDRMPRLWTLRIKVVDIVVVVVIIIIDLVLVVVAVVVVVNNFRVIVKCCGNSRVRFLALRSLAPF